MREVNTMMSRQFLRPALLAIVALLLQACGSSSSGGGAQQPPAPPPPPPPPTASFAVTVTNLSNAQPLSPVAVIAHGEAYALFSVGDPASPGLEVMAEGGDNGQLLSEADADSAVLATASGAAAIGPAGNETINIDAAATNPADLRLSVGTMLVNTNDAFAGLNSMPVGSLAVGEVRTFRAIAYDSGTEANSESAAHIPGPAGGGEGFNAARDDRSDQVAMHAGVVGQDDGFADSDLNNQHRFDNPVVMIRIERSN